MSKYVVTLFTPIAIGVGITWLLMRDENKDISDFKKEQGSTYRKFHENNEQIFKYIQESTKSDKIVHFAKDDEIAKQVPVKPVTAQTSKPPATAPTTTKPQDKKQ
ncbi:hypothetical protein SAMD00019534_118110 [Acytostelium subglobosum LB1]|uniref:hypothetical protein n=1 Tax=Acytostelium subglobosum LB1 TaxID=1410327 RepID=UPI000644BC07|nr:hypothetical protein SAMD00019534_118110 [Acytostelium subglobosum LB1]GAM28635.1 hypothetical protein SAMD00019534_118110 [Acytostelium subglobosum LB1]|eukprot:XP_012748413.1 hypothetical protein SAMD00019534_118110 [Acytostelium subglobosum LB1]